MNKVPTIHNSASIGDIAKTVIMPGDPLRAKYIAENFLENVFCYNEVRGMLGYTGLYKGVKISVQASGMGCPSMGIYSYELYNFYEVENIIRVGTAGTLKDTVNVRDMVLASRCYTDSNYLKLCGIDDDKIEISESILDNIKASNEINGIPIKFETVFTSDVFYTSTEYLKEISLKGCAAIEMETAALYANAFAANKKAVSILTITDDMFNGIHLTSEDRQKTADEMIKCALEIAIKLN